jgi:hypothetical protein
LDSVSISVTLNPGLAWALGATGVAAAIPVIAGPGPAAAIANQLAGAASAVGAFCQGLWVVQNNKNGELDKHIKDLEDNLDSLKSLFEDVENKAIEAEAMWEVMELEAELDHLAWKYQQTQNELQLWKSIRGH